MSQAIGSLVVEIAGNVARFQQDMASMQQIAGQAAQRIEGALGGIGTGLKALAGAAAFVAMKNLIDSSIEAKAKLADLSIQSGITVEALGGLGKVAAYSNTSLDDIVASSNKLAKALVGETEESKGAAQAIKALGLSFNDIKNSSPDEQMLKVARAFENFRDGSEKSAAAMLLFGKQGAQMLPFLKELAERGEQTSNTTTEQARAAKEYEDNLVTMRKQQDAWAGQTANALLPALIEVTNAIIAFRAEGEKTSLVATVIKTAFEAITIFASDVIFVFRVFGKEIGALVAQIAVLAEAMNGATLLERLNPLALFRRLAAAIKSEPFRAISEAVYEDTRRARKELDAFQQRVLQGGASPFNARGISAADRNAGGDTRRRLAIAPPNTESDSFIKQLQRQVETQEHGRIEMLRMEAAQKKVSAAAAPYIAQLEAIEERQRNIARTVEQVARDEEQRAKITGLITANNATARVIVDQANALGLTAREQRRVTEMRRIDIQAQEAMVNATKETRAEIELVAEAMRGDLTAALDELERREEEVSGSVMQGIKNSLEAYRKRAQDVAGFTENLITGSLQRMEDAVINFARTGKIQIGDLFRFMAEEYIRQVFRMQAQNSGFASWFGNLFGGFGGGSGGGTTLGNTTTGADLDLFYSGALGKTGAAATAGKTALGGSQKGGTSGAVTINYGGLSFGAGVGRNEVLAAMQTTRKQTIADIEDARRRGTVAR